MKHSKFIFSIFLMIVTFACTPKKMINDVPVMTNDQKIRSNQLLDGIPLWFSIPPVDDENYIYSTAQSTGASFTQQATILTLENLGRQAMAQKLQTKVQALQRSFLETVTTADKQNYDATFTNVNKQTTDQSLNNTSVARTRCLPIPQNERLSGNVNERCFIIMQMPVGQAKEAYENALSTDEELYTKFKASQHIKIFKMNFQVLVTNKLFFKIFFFVLQFLLCEKLLSQSIYFSDTDTLSFSIEENNLHGLGVDPINISSSNSSFTDTCQRAMLDFSSSHFISVHIEIFQNGGNKFYEFPELAIVDSTFEFSENQFDSKLIFGNDSVHCLVKKKKNDSNSLQYTIPELNMIGLSPIKLNNFWYAIGQAEELIHQKNKTWLMSKNNALKKLAKSLDTEIKSNQIQINGSLHSFGYFKTRVIFKNVIVVKRMVINSKYYSVIAVSENSITVL